MTTNIATNDALSPRLLGSTGLRVCPLTLGTMTFGEGSWRAGEEEARAIFHRYLEAGGNSIDTADVYGGGRSEELLGPRALVAVGQRLSERQVHARDHHRRYRRTPERRG